MTFSCRRLEDERDYLQSEFQSQYNFEDIVGQSAAIKQVLEQVAIVAPTDSTVLLIGESGTGKELVARAIHDLSRGRDRTFVRLNCAAVPSGLLESELFGHEKGAFTGALAQKTRPDRTRSSRQFVPRRDRRYWPGATAQAAPGFAGARV